MDIAGITEKPALRSGAVCFAVYNKDAAVISVASSHVERTKPPIPRADLYFFAFFRIFYDRFPCFDWVLACFFSFSQSSANSPAAHMDILRVMGYRDIKRMLHHEGIHVVRSRHIIWCFRIICLIFPRYNAILNVNFQLQEPVQFTPCVVRTTLS